MGDTAPTAAASTSISFNLNYVTSISGILKIAEIILGLICWACVASIKYYPAAHQFVLFVTITSWILTIFLFVIYLFGLHASTCSGAPWGVIEFGFNAFWGLLYFIAACVAAAYTYNASVLVAAAVFAFFTTIAYLIHTAISLKEWRGSFPWESSASPSGGATGSQA